MATPELRQIWSFVGISSEESERGAGREKARLPSQLQRLLEKVPPGVEAAPRGSRGPFEGEHALEHPVSRL